MKYVDEFRDPRLARELVAEIRVIATRRWVLMDVCGGQTHSLLRHGIEDALADVVELIHGPGCPVCVTPLEAIDFAQSLALRPDVTLASFGDMLRVPGSQGSLQTIRSRGGTVRTVYAPIDAVRLAQENPDQQYVFFAVGFETTAPATAIAVLQAERLGLQNFSLLVSHVSVLPAMEALVQAPDNRVQAFLGAGHVCTITGFDRYVPLAKRFRIPIVVTGFEPIDLLRGIREAVRQLESGRSEVVNCFRRSVIRSGNQAAQRAIQEVYEVSDRRWRGFGVIADGGLRLRERFRQFDAERRFQPEISLPVVDDSQCRSADVLAGRIKPRQCPEFARGCNPDTPLGAPMVSSEGACAAYFHYQRSDGESLLPTAFSHGEQ
jgi:hydrogenase expression/formation protein HypD